MYHKDNPRFKLAEKILDHSFFVVGIDQLNNPCEMRL